MKSNNNELVGDMARMGGGRESRMHTGFWWGDLNVDGRTIWNWIFKNRDGETWTGLILIIIGRVVGILWMRSWIFGFYNCAVLGYYASSGNFLPPFRDNLSVITRKGTVVSYFAPVAWIETTFGLHKMRGISWLTEDLFGSQKGLC